MTELHFVVPDGIDDPRRPSGGNVYDRRVIDGLAGLGWAVHVRRIDELARIPDGELVLLDGLVMSDAVADESSRLRLVALLHMPIESPVLAAATGVITTSRWTRRWLLDAHSISPDRIQVVEPGVEIGVLSPGTPSGGEILCVGAVTPTKGHDVLVDALAEIADLEWRCTCVGSLDIEPAFVSDLSREHLSFTGPLAGSALDAAYAGADVLVSASRAESYGMVVTEALARGLPVIATDVGGVPEALGRSLGRTEEGELPGLLVPSEDPSALASALRLWLSDATLRERLRKAAQARRLELTDWTDASAVLARAIQEVAR